MAINPEDGFTADVIRDSERFVGRSELIKDCISALNAKTGLISVFGKRGVGKSSLMRQLQHMALGDYTLAKHAGLDEHIPSRPRSYLTVYYTCDSLITNGEDLLKRLCNDQDGEDGLLRLVPDDGKEIVEFMRSKEVSLGADLKVVSWGGKGVESSKYARVVPGDVVQTFRNFVNSIVEHQVVKRMGRDSLLIILDEFDVIGNKSGIGSLIKSLTGPTVKFAICGVGRDLSQLITDHGSVDRLIEQGVLPVLPMSLAESMGIINRAEQLFRGEVQFAPGIATRIAEMGQGYPYFVQLIGKQCIHQLNEEKASIVDDAVLDRVEQSLRTGKAFPTLEQAYKKAIGPSQERQLLLHLLAEQPSETSSTDQIGRVTLKGSRTIAEEMGVQFVDQVMPRLVDPNYGPVLERIEQGVYEFVNPVLRQYIRLRAF